MNNGVPLYFDDPRLNLGVGGRILARALICVTYASLAIAALMFLLSDITRIFWIGVAIALFLCHRALYRMDGDRSLLELPANAESAAKLNLTDFLSPASKSLLEFALDRTQLLGGSFYLHLLRRLSAYGSIAYGLRRLDIKKEDWIKRIDAKSAVRDKEKKIAKAEILSQIQGLLALAFNESLKNRDRFIEPMGVFQVLVKIKNADLREIFGSFGVTEDDMDAVAIFSSRGRLLSRFSLPTSLGEFGSRHRARVRHRFMNRSWTARPTPTLDEFSTDLTDLARSNKIGFLIGHEAELNRLLNALSRPYKSSALLVGDPGVGKETIVHHLAFLLEKDLVPSPLFDSRLVELNLGRVVVGVSAGELEKRLVKILDEIRIAGNVILYIPDIDNLVKTSGPQYLSAADILLPPISKNEFRVVGATYPKEFRESVESQTDFASAFEIIRVEELSEKDAKKLLIYESMILEKDFGIAIGLGAIKEAVRIGKRYFHAKPLPSSAEELLKETLTEARRANKKILEADDVVKVAEEKVNVPIHRAGEAEATKLLNLEEIIHESLIDQNEAVVAVSNVLREYRSGLARSGGPIAAFLFVGPTGVGKTELSKILAKIQFGSKEAMVRFDMAEYQEKSSINRLLGAPDGSVSGTLTESIREKPYSLVLLDEFEKSHPDILNLFLAVFDDGRLTDNLGRTVDFQNAIIIATSNAHSDFIKKSLEDGRAMKEIADELKIKLSDYFKPELINRFSDIIVFRALSRDDILAIVKIQLAELADLAETGNGLELSFDGTAVRKIAELGYDPVFGARPLRKVINDNLRKLLADEILRGEIKRGNKAVIIFENGKFGVKVAA